jgi:hypothetical protein
MKQLKKFKGASLHISNTPFKRTIKRGRKIKTKLDLTKDPDVRKSTSA